jgi:hypothetical protein
MKKKIAAGVTVVSLLAAGVALAVTNTYSVTASTSPTKAGTAAKPTNIALNFNYSVGEVDNNRPSSVKEYQIKFSGVNLSQKGLGTCTADQINGAGSNAPCPASAIVGTGSVSNKLGATSNPADQSLNCFLALTVYNAKAKHATLYLEGDNSSSVPEDKRCIAPLKVAIDATYKVGTGSNSFSTLAFQVPSTLLHPAPGLDNAVKNVQSTIKNVKTKLKVGGKAVSYYRSVGGCKKGKRPVQVTFISEDNKTSVAKTTAKCTK